MGSGRWSPDTYHARTTARTRAGKDVFDYSNDAVSSGRLRPHQTLDPQGLALASSRDSAEHPDSNSIIISLDVTGSMVQVVRAIHDDLPHFTSCCSVIITSPIRKSCSPRLATRRAIGCRCRSGSSSPTTGWTRSSRR